MTTIVVVAATAVSGCASPYCCCTTHFHPSAQVNHAHDLYSTSILGLKGYIFYFQPGALTFEPLKIFEKFFFVVVLHGKMVNLTF